METLKHRMAVLGILALVVLIGYASWNDRLKDVDYYVAHPDEAQAFDKQCRAAGMPVFSTDAKTNHEKNCMTVYSAEIVLKLKEK